MGNTNASLAFVSFVEGSTARAEGAVPVGGVSAIEILATWGRDDDEPLRVQEALAGPGRLGGAGQGRRCAAISAVGSHERERRLVERLGSLGWDVAVRPEAGLVMEIHHPETCGSDRQYAMRAALEDGWRLRSEAVADGAGERLQVLVVDAGTALTVDAGVLRSGAAANGGAEFVFLGGAIAMGPGSLAEAITARGARLAPFEVDPDVPALGRSTVEALRAGASVGFRGAVRELCRGVSMEAFGGTRGVLVYLTGGARAFARAAVDETFPQGFRDSPHLVHAGLALAIRSAGSSSL
ncbi:Type III pantothenate kinase [Planctomycetes bacterium Poly30]|uniref:Type III pantothenate kinase n=1 Tax=Saltatorellus ferox TaxID=2528018 RepID=A0A518EWA0_9BACT|nr:Type III pantothenate kinase [Planctomycetes bacterium Poly30]